LQSGALDLYAPLGLPPTIHLSRLGEAINPNVLAGALLLIMPFPLMLMLTKGWTDRRGLHLLAGIAFVFIVIVIGSTQSRGAYLAMAIVIPLLLVMRWPRLIYGVPLIIAGAIGFVFWIGPQKFIEMLTFSTSTPGLDQRLEIWSRAWYGVWDFAFTGIGIGMFDVVIPLLYPYFLIPPMETIPHAHNLYLQIGVDLGMPGLIAYLALWINLFFMLAPLLRKRRGILSWAMATGAFGSLLAMLLHGLVDAVTWGNKLAFLPWWLYALITLLFLRYQREEHSITG
jgi:putative inorganic carbon (hco3(-)) transporter